MPKSLAVRIIGFFTVFAFLTTGLTTTLNASENKPRIVNGESAVMSDVPYQVQLLMNYSISGGYLCGGSLIADSWVLTAAHCVEPVPGETLNVTVYAGNADTFAGVTRQVSEIFIHPNYSNGFKFINDVALLRLAQPYNLAPGSIQTIALPDADILDLTTFPSIETEGVISGWGTTSFGGVVASTLNKATVKTLNSLTSQCGAYADSQFYPTVMLCAQGGQWPTLTDACQGDSGGPLAVTVDNIPYLTGITSFGVQCAIPNYPGVYTRVSSFLPWIIPSQPSGFSGSYANDTIALTASFANAPALQVTRVELYKSVDSSSFTLINTSEYTTNYTFTDTDINPDSEYQYRLLYVNTISDSNTSLQKYATTPVISATTPAPAPEVENAPVPSVPSAPEAPAPTGSSPAPISTPSDSGGAQHALTELRPSSGSLRGGYLVSLIGFGFSTVREVQFGGIAVPFTLRSDAHIEVNLPAFTFAGPVDVKVILAPEVGSALAPGGFLLLATSPTPGGPTNPTTPPNDSNTANPSQVVKTINNPVKGKTYSSGLQVVPRNKANTAKTINVKTLASSPSKAKPVKVKAKTNIKISLTPANSTGSVFVKIGNKFIRLGSFTNAETVYLPVLQMPNKTVTIFRIGTGANAQFIRVSS